MGKLTAAKLKSLSKPGRYGDGDGLYFRVTPGGSKNWVQRIVINGKRCDLGLGAWPVISLAEARERAFENRRAVAHGRDPLAEKRRAAMPTFAESAERFHEASKAKWRSEKHAKNWAQIMSKYALPAIGARRVDAIDQADILRILTPIWGSRSETAKKLRQNIRAVFAWAQAHKMIENNPADDRISGALPPMPRVKVHFRSLPYQEVPAALETIEASRASMAAKLCLRFVVLTACRSGEARGATWGEIDIEGRTWTIPGERMKGGREWRQPLSDAAADTLKKARMLDDGNDLVFPSPLKSGKPLSDMTLTKLLRDTGLAEKCTVHGYRSSFRDFASERTNADFATMEQCLAHAVGSAVERSYARSDLLDKRRRLMDHWAAFVTGGKCAKVVQLRG